MPKNKVHSVILSTGEVLTSDVDLFKGVYAVYKPKTISSYTSSVDVFYVQGITSRSITLGLCGAELKLLLKGGQIQPTEFGSSYFVTTSREEAENFLKSLRVEK